MGGNVFHSSAWGSMVEAHGAQAIPFEVVYGNAVVGLGIAAARRSRFPLMGRFRDHLMLETPPILEPGHAFQPAYEALISFAHRERFADLTIDTTDCLVSPIELPEADRRGERVEFWVDLSWGHDGVIERMSTNHRRNIRKARRTGFDVIEDSTLEGAMSLRSLQDATFERRLGLGQTRGTAWDRDDYRRTMASYVNAGVMNFWFIERHGERLSGLGVLRFGSRAYYLVGGTSSRGYECGAAFAAFDAVLARLTGQGFAVLNLGGTPAAAGREGDMDYGLYRFKLGFGSRVLRLATLKRHV